MNSQRVLAILALIALLGNGFVACNQDQPFAGYVVTTQFLEQFNGKFYDSQTSDQLAIGTQADPTFTYLRRYEDQNSSTPYFCVLAFQGTVAGVVQRTYEDRQLHWYAANYKLTANINRVVLTDGTREQGTIIRTCSDLAYDEQRKGTYAKDFMLELFEEAGTYIPPTSTTVQGWSIFNPNGFRLHMFGGETWDGNGTRPLDASDETFTRFQ